MGVSGVSGAGRREACGAVALMGLRKVCAVTGSKLPLYGELPSFPTIERRLYVGLPGAGKSLQMVHATLQRMARGELVWCNFNLVHRPLGLRAGFIGSWDAFLAVCALRGVEKTIVIQEANGACPARDFNSLPARVRESWANVRHSRTTLYMDSQHEEHIDKIMRHIVSGIIICEPTRYTDVLGLYKQTWCTPEYAATYRRAVSQDLATIVQGGELDVVPPRGNLPGSGVRWVRGWEHTCYDTHEDIRLWEYKKPFRADEQHPRPLRHPERWEAGEWVPVQVEGEVLPVPDLPVEPIAEDETVAGELV